MEKYAIVHGTVPNKYGDLGVVPVQCDGDGTPDSQSPYVKFNFRLYDTQEEAEGALSASEAVFAQMKKESDALKAMAPLGNDGAKNYTCPLDRDAQRFWRD